MNSGKRDIAFFGQNLTQALARSSRLRD